MPRNGDGCEAEDEANGRSLGEADNDADTPLRGNPKGRGDSGPMAALLAPDVEQPHGVARALPCGQTRPVAHADIYEMSSKRNGLAP